MEGRKLETLIPGLADAAADSGLVNVQRDPDDFIRRMTVVDHELPGLDLAVYRRLQFGKPVPFMLGEQGDWLQLADNRVPLPLVVNFAGPAHTFPMVSFHEVFYKDVPARLGGMGLFKGKVVYIGSTTEILHDNYPTPFAPAKPMPGVEIHANTLDTLLSREYFTYLPPWCDLLLILGLGALSSLLTFRMAPGLARPPCWACRPATPRVRGGLHHGPPAALHGRAHGRHLHQLRRPHRLAPGGRGAALARDTHPVLALCQQSHRG